MKKIFAILALSAIGLNTLLAQDELNAYTLSRNDLTGTARSIGMGGAFGALGGDISSIAINPAGIGVFVATEFAGSLNFSNTKTKPDYVTSYMGNRDNLGSNKSKFRVMLDNFGVVGSINLDDDEVPRLNIGFTYNKLKSFDRKYKLGAAAIPNSLTDYIASRADGYSESQIKDDGTDNFYGGSLDWLASLGYTGFLINPLNIVGGRSYESAVPTTESTDAFLNVTEKGSINTFDFNVGTTISDVFSVGLTVAITDIDYKMTSSHQELFSNDDYFNLQNWQKTEGTGWQIKTGVIYKPIDELRIGVAYHSPTWYDMTRYQSAELEFDMQASQPAEDPQNTNGWTRTGSFRNDYDFRTPDKWTFSLASVIGKRAILSADYEITDYSKMKYKNWDGLNDNMKGVYKLASTLRVGAEFLATQQFSIRAGYAWQQSGLKNDYRQGDLEVYSLGAAPHFVQEGDTHNITFGLGYRFSPRFYVDLGFAMTQRKDNAFMFSNVNTKDFTGTQNIVVNAPMTKLKFEKYQAVLTFGYRLSGD